MRVTYYLWSFLFCSVINIQAQSIPSRSISDTTVTLKTGKSGFNKAGTDGDFPISLYQIINQNRDTTLFDTTLTIQKDYKHNYLRRDLFELMPMSNVAQSYNALALQDKRSTWFPEMGASAKHMNFMHAEDINYYRVPTPTTELFWKTVMEQGQILDALFTANTSERLNLFIAYKGTRSLGKYQNILSSTGHFRMGFDYHNESKRYYLRAHHTSQDLLNQENGGILVPEQFTSGEAEFIDRSRVDVRFQDAENFLLGKRWYLDQSFWIVKAGDSLGRNGLQVFHQLEHENRTYEYRQDAANAYFGEAFQAQDIADRAKLKTFRNTLGLRWKGDIIGDLEVNAQSYDYNYYFNSVVITDDQQIESRLKDSEIALGAAWKKQIGRFGIHGRGVQTLVGDLGGTRLDAGIQFPVKNWLDFEGGIELDSRMPNFNFLLYQSDYQQYNWQNTSAFEKESRTGIYAKLGSKWFGSLDARYQLLTDYTYFAEVFPEVAEGAEVPDVQLVRPFQYDSDINYLKLTWRKEFRFGKFALDNTVMYQQVDQGTPVLNLPEVVTRNTLYFSSHLFRKALYLQTGVTFKYFTAYNMNGYSPVLGEFFVQDREEIGDFPMMDFFINAKVRRTRIYLKAEHLNSSFTGYNFYSAPGYPYRDFVIRFGLVWNFFS